MTHEGPDVNCNVSAVSTAKSLTQCHLQDILGRGGQLAWKSPTPGSDDDLIQLHGLVVPTEKPCWPQLGALQVLLLATDAPPAAGTKCYKLHAVKPAHQQTAEQGRGSCQGSPGALENTEKPDRIRNQTQAVRSGHNQFDSTTL